MNKKLKVLIIEDSDRYQAIYGYILAEKVELLQALDLEGGERLFAVNPDVALVVMDACVPGGEINSIPLCQKIRQTFCGPMIAASARSDYREVLVRDGGCDYESLKDEVPLLVCELLGLEVQ